MSQEPQPDAVQADKEKSHCVQCGSDKPHTMCKFVQADEVKLHNTLDANIWAKEFMRLQKKFGWEVDLDMMRGWFANAIMVGANHSRWNKVAELEAKLKDMSRAEIYTCSCNEYKLRIAELQSHIKLLCKDQQPQIDTRDAKIDELEEKLSDETYYCNGVRKTVTEQQAKIDELKRELLHWQSSYKDQFMKYSGQELVLNTQLEESRLQIQAQKKCIDELVRTGNRAIQERVIGHPMVEAGAMEDFEFALQSAAELGEK